MKIDRRSDIDSAELERIVRKEIDWQFYEAWLTDQQVPEMYERYPEKELKEEAYAIFFKSFDDILEMIGVRNKKIILHLSWWEMTRKIESYKIVDQTISEQLPEDEDFKQSPLLFFRLDGTKG